MIMKKQILALTTLLTLAGSAFAVPQLRMSDGTTTIIVTDNDANDSDPTAGVVTYFGDIGQWKLSNLESGATKPSDGSPSEPYIDLDSFSASSAAGDLTVQFTDTDYTAATGTFDAEVGGFAGGTASFTYYIDPNNAPFGTNIIVAAFPASNVIGSASNGTINVTAPYSITIEAKIHHTTAANTGFDAQFTITPPQQQPPTIQCAGDHDIGCNPTTIPSCDTNSVVVNASCGVSNITCSTAGPDIVTGCIHERDLVYTVTDNCGQTTSCTQHIYWTIDTTAPNFTKCAGDQDLGCNPSVIPDCDMSQVAASDDCSRAAITCDKVDSADGCNHRRTITYTATDNCGNSATCAQHITWTVDTTAPSFTKCDAGRDLGCNPATLPVCDTSSVIATDDCGTPNVSCSSVDGTNGCARSRTITYIASDACGNTSSCVQQYTWTVDHTAPTFTKCADDQDLGCNPASVPDCDTNAVIATDDCTTSTITCSSADTTNGCSRTRAITYVATDACGNSASCVQHITWTANRTAPTITQCAADRDLGCNPSTIPTGDVNAITAHDDCGSVTVTKSSVDSSSSCGRTRTITYTATDACGNTATCVQHITWTVNTTAPTFSKCAADKDLGCNPSTITTGDITQVTAGDDCSTATITKSYADSTNGCSRTRTITYRATDACGNTATCVQHITWNVDNTPPTFTSCPADMTVTTCDANCATATYSGSATDNCGSATVTFSPASGSCLPAGTNTVTATATDSCGNKTTKTFHVIVQAGIGCWVTFTPGGWGAPPNGNNVAQLLKNTFSIVYPSGFKIGGNYTISLSTQLAIQNYLPSGGTPGVLTKNYSNPTSTSAGEFGSQVTALKLNCDYSTKGLFKVGLTTLHIAPGYPLAGQTVSQVLTLCQTVLGGKTSALPAGVTVSQLTSLLSGINGNYDGGLTNNGVLVP